MLIDRLLERFDPVEVLPVDVNQLKDALIELGIQDEIEFHFVSMDSQKIRAMLYRYTYHNGVYGDPILHSDIIIAQDQGDEDEAWQRLGAVKELLHITDCTQLTAQSDEAVEKLFKHLSLPAELRTPDLNTNSALNDRMRIFLALAILVPKACRAKLRELHGQGLLSYKEIALLTKVPERYSDAILDEEFEVAIQAFTVWEQEKAKL